MERGRGLEREYWTRSCLSFSRHPFILSLLFFSTIGLFILGFKKFRWCFKFEKIKDNKTFES